MNSILAGKRKFRWLRVQTTAASAGLLLAALGATVSATPVVASSPSTVRFKSESATATFFRSNGCILTEAFVNAFKSTTQQNPGGPVIADQMSVVVVRFDQCNNFYIFDAQPDDHFPPPRFEFQLHDDLSEGQLETRVRMLDGVNGIRFTVDVAVAWRGVGKVQHTTTNTTTQYPDRTVTTAAEDFSRDARATAEVSGSVGGPRENFTPNPSTSAGLDRFRSEEITTPR